jgi:hypothetical protein
MKPEMLTFLLYSYYEPNSRKLKPWNPNLWIFHNHLQHHMKAFVTNITVPILLWIVCSFDIYMCVTQYLRKKDMKVSFTTTTPTPINGKTGPILTNTFSTRLTSWYNINNTYKIYIFQHPGAIFRELLLQRFMHQPANLCFL